MTAKTCLGRKTFVLDCRETMSLRVGGGLAQSGTFSASDSPEIVVIAMSPHRRHVTKPVCQITYGLREAGFRVSVLVLNTGQGIPPDSPFVGAPSGATCEISEEEIEKINKHKLAIIHLGSVKEHVIYKARYLLRHVKIPVIIVCQVSVDFEDLTKKGVRTRLSEKKHGTTEYGKGVTDIVTGVIRGLDVDEEKLKEIVSKVKKWLSAA